MSFSLCRHLQSLTLYDDERQSLPSSPVADTTTTILTIDDNDDDYEQVTYIQCRSVD